MYTNASYNTEVFVVFLIVEVVVGDIGATTGPAINPPETLIIDDAALCRHEDTYFSHLCHVPIAMNVSFLLRLQG